jgi:MFS transporter, FHS family, L-fucose permease
MLARVADQHNSTAYAMIIPVMFFVMAYSYALAVNFIPSYRDSADKVGEGEFGVPKEGSVEKGNSVDLMEKEKV